MKGRGVYVSVELEARDDDQTAKAEQSENKRTFFFCWVPGHPENNNNSQYSKPPNPNPSTSPFPRQSPVTEQLLLVPLGELSPHTAATNPAVKHNACPPTVFPQTHHHMMTQHHSSELTIPRSHYNFIITTNYIIFTACQHLTNAMHLSSLAPAAIPCGTYMLRATRHACSSASGIMQLFQ